LANAPPQTNAASLPTNPVHLYIFPSGLIILVPSVNLDVEIFPAGGSVRALTPGETFLYLPESQTFTSFVFSSITKKLSVPLVLSPTMSHPESSELAST
jgi:hypothetical protein